MRYWLILGIVILLVRAGLAQTTRPIELFNGHDLSNWSVVLDDKRADASHLFTVKDGVLHCVGWPTGYLRTKDKYTNFVLKVQWRFPDKPGNSGVLIRCQEPDKVWPKSVECQLNSGDAGDLWVLDNYPIRVDPSRTGGRRTTKLHPSNEKPIGQWNQYEITVDGETLTVKVNGELQNEASEFKEQPGFILLQSEGAEIEFRNIELTPLDRED